MKKQVDLKPRWLIILSLAFIAVLGGVGTVSAAEFPKGETIPASQTIDDDVFISGANVVVDGTVNGILFATGQTVTINGTVNGDAVLMGESIIVNESAHIAGNLFIGSAEIVLRGSVDGSMFGGSSAMKFARSADVARNMFYGGFSLTTETDSLVGRDLFVAAYQALLSGAVERDLRAGAAAVELNGSIGRNASIDVGEVEESTESSTWMSFNPWISKYVEQVVQPGLRVADNASIAGNTTLTSSVDASSQLDQIAAGSVIYQTPVPYSEAQPQKDFSGEVKSFQKEIPGQFLINKGLTFIRTFIKLFVLGALALWLLAKPFKKLIDAAYQQPMASFGWGFVLIAVGFLAVLIVPLVFIMLGILIGFLSLGSLLSVWFGLIGTSLLLAAMLFFFAVFAISKLLAAYMFGKWLMKAVFKQTEEKDWLNLLVGVLLYVFIRAIPVIGWLPALAATLIGTGAFWLALAKTKKKKA